MGGSGRYATVNLGIFGQSGWGKSHTAQEKAELNLPDVDYAVIFDYKDEYRGLVTAGLTRWGIAGPRERTMSVTDWRRYFERNKKVTLARYMLDDDEWQHVVARVGLAFRRIYEESRVPAKILILIDEAHAVAPQETGFPDAVGKIAVLGRGEGVSTIWVSQRPAMVDKNIVSQCTAMYAGGFTEENDRDALGVEYPTVLHNPKAQPGMLERYSIPDELRTADGSVAPVRKFTNAQDNVVASEWIYSDERGELWREKRTGDRMQTTHYGHDGWRLKV